MVPPFDARQSPNYACFNGNCLPPRHRSRYFGVPSEMSGLSQVRVSDFSDARTHLIVTANTTPPTHRPSNTPTAHSLPDIGRE